MKLLVALPCLNEEATVAAVLSEIPDSIEGVDEIVTLVIDDGSTDRTREVAEAAGAEVLSHGSNRGVGVAFQSVLSKALRERYDLLVTIDADRQFDTADIPRLLAPILAGRADFVTASRFTEGGEAPGIPALKRWGNARMANLVSRLAGRRFADVSCGFRAFSREALLNLNLHGRYTYTQETFLDLCSKGLRIEEVPVHVDYPPGRRSRVAGNLWLYGWKTLCIILAADRDFRPLRFFWSIAAALMGLGAAVASILLVHYLRTSTFSGQLWSGFLGGFLIGAGLLFFVLGVLADMMRRMRTNQERILTELKRGARD